jgi:hypothetical protein
LNPIYFDDYGSGPGGAFVPLSPPDFLACALIEGDNVRLVFVVPGKDEVISCERRLNRFPESSSRSDVS